MDEIIVTVCFLSLMTLASSNRPILGPPHVTLNCQADYVTLSKTVEVSWKPSFLKNDTSITSEDVAEHIQNCVAHIICNNGYTKKKNCYYGGDTNSYSITSFQGVRFIEALCTVEVALIDYYDFIKQTIHRTSKNCSFSVPNSTIIMQGSTGSATLGQSYSIQCSIQMSEQVDSSIVKIDWNGPNGSITNDSRINVHPTISNNGIIYNSTLEFLYLSQNDSGSFTCSVAILNLSQTYRLDNITLPTPNVSITAVNYQTFNNSLSLECIITTVRGISVDIVWKVNDAMIRRMNNSLGNLVNNSIIHRDVYHISNVGNEGTEYHCHGVINESSIANSSFILTPSPTTSTSTTASAVLNSTDSTMDSTVNSPIETFPASFISTATVPSPTSTDSSPGANDKNLIIYFAAISFLLASLLTVALICIFIRRSYLKRVHSTDNDFQFKAPSISNCDETLGGRDDVSICESLDINDKVVTWIKTTQEPNLDEQHDDGHPSNEEILNYVCGQGVKCYNPRHNESSELFETKVDLCTLTNNDNREEAVDSMISHDDHDIESLLLLEKRTLEDDNVQTLDKDGSRSIQAVTNNTEEDCSLSAVQSTTNLNGTVSHSCNNTNTINIEVVVSSGQASLNSINKSTEDSSLSSYSINASVAEGEYIETKSSTYSAVEGISCVPMQSYKSFHQNIVTHSHDERHSSTSAIEGEYVDHNIAVQENECIKV